MADQHILADDRRIALGPVRHRAVAMNDAALLDVAARADANVADVRAQHAIVPDADVGSDDHVADDAAAGRDEGARVVLRRLAVHAVDRNVATRLSLPPITCFHKLSSIVLSLSSLLLSCSSFFLFLYSF